MLVQSTKASKNPHTEEASSMTTHSLLHFKHLPMEEVILKSSLFRSKEMIDGSMIIAIIIIAMIPHEFLIKDMLDVMVLNASLTVEPTIGIKLLIANLAVFIDILSVD